MIFLGKKKAPAENLEKSLEKEHQKEINTTNPQNLEKGSKLKKPRLEDLDPNLRILDYIYTKQKHSLNRNSILRPMTTNLTSFENLLSTCRRTFTNLNKSNSKHLETLSFLDELVSADDLKGSRAIIIVPASFYPGNLCLENAKRFLQDAVYTDPSQQQTSSEGVFLTSSNNIFTRKFSGKEITFEIHSNVRNFTRSDWKRIVAVFVQGSDWEFSDWPKNENITSILLKIRGFHLKYTDLPTNENIKKWNVKLLEVNRFKRHFDVSIQNEFWNILESFLNQPRYREKHSSY